MGTVTAKAAEILIRKDDPSPVLDDVVNAGCCRIGEERAADSIVLAVDKVHSLPVVDRVIEFLCGVGEVGAIDHVSLIERNVVWKVEGWGIFAGCKCGKQTEEDDISEVHIIMQFNYSKRCIKGGKGKILKRLIDRI
jgi:hypothetical protein